eukprot:SM000089S23839  [mRNA]  locus=s89:348792:349004:+ [translate_table: standard]
MGSGLGELGISAAINIGIVLAFFAAFSVARRQPINARIYYSKWFVKDPKVRTLTTFLPVAGTTAERIQRN